MAESAAEGKITLWGLFRERTLIYLGLRGQPRETKPKIGPFLFAGVVFGAVLGVPMQWFSGHSFSGWVAIYSLIFGIVVFSPGTYWLASRRWRSKKE